MISNKSAKLYSNIPKASFKRTPLHIAQMKAESDEVSLDGIYRVVMDIEDVLGCESALSFDSLFESP